MRIVSYLIVYFAALIGDIQALYLNSSSNSTSVPAYCYGGCGIFEGSVRVMYFPEMPKKNSTISSAAEVVTAILDGFTFTSPSVYVAYSTLAAGYFQSLSGCPASVGLQYYNTTRAYPPDYLMTYPSNCDYHGLAARDWSTLRIKDLMDPPQNWISIKGCFWDYSPHWVDGPNGTDMAAKPVISIPPDIYSLDPEWIRWGCSARGAYQVEFLDPPTALTPVSAMVTASTDPGIATTPTPQTAPAIQQGTVHPSPGSVATFAPVAMTKDPSKDSGPTLSPDPPSSEGPSSKSNPLSSADPPSNAEPPSNEDPRPSIPKSNAAEHTTPTETEALASSYATENPSRSPFLVATVGSQQIYALPNGAVAVQGKTIKPDDPAITVDGTPISVGLSSIYVGGSAFQIPPSITALDPLPSTLNDKPIEAAAAGAVLLGEQMISEGQVTTVDGSRISNGQDRIVIGSTTFAKSRGGGPVPASLPTPPPMLNGKHIDAATAGGLLFDGQMISEGQAMTVDGYTIFNGHDRMIIDSITFGKPLDSGRLPTAGPTPLLSAIDGKSLEYDGDDAPVLDGHTISSGQQTTIDGKDVAITAGDLVVDGTTYALPRISHTTISKAPSPSSMNNNPLRFDEDGNLVYDGRTMSPGQQTTINGKHVVIEPSDVVIDSTTYPLSVLPRPTAAAAKTTSPLTQINGEEVRFDPEGEIVIGGSTMSPDQQTTVQGVYISAGHGRAVVGSHTYSSAPSAANTLGGPGVVTPSSIFGGSEASLAIPTLTASGAAATAQAGDSPISSAAGKDSPSGEPGLGAIILAALEDMPSQTQAGASPAAASQTSSNVTAGSVTPFDPSSNSGVMASSISFWIGSAVTGFAMLVLPL